LKWGAGKEKIPSLEGKKVTWDHSNGDRRSTTKPFSNGKKGSHRANLTKKKGGGEKKNNPQGACPGVAPCWRSCCTLFWTKKKGGKGFRWGIARGQSATTIERSVGPKGGDWESGKRWVIAWDGKLSYPGKGKKVSEKRPVPRETYVKNGGVRGGATHNKKEKF